MPRPSMTGYLWQNGVTVLIDTAFNAGVVRVLDYIDAHVHNTTVGGQAADQHTASHILSPALAINVASTGTTVDLGARLNELATRIHAIEGDAAANWQSGAAPTTLKAVADAIANHTIIAAAPTAVAYSAITDLALTATGTSNVISLAPGTIVASTGATVDVAAGQTVTPTATGATQYFPLSITDAGTLTLGAAAASRALAVLPTGATALEQVFVPASCVGIYSSQALWQAAGSPANKGYLLPRPVKQAFAVGGGGGGGAPTTAKYWISGTNGSLGSANDATNAATVDFIQPNLIRTALATASMQEVLANFVQQDLYSRIQFVTGDTQVQLSASSGNPLVVSVGGVRYKATATVGPVSGASGGAGNRLLVVDVSGGSVALVSPAPIEGAFTPGAGQGVIGKIPHDGSIFRWKQSVDYGGIMGMLSSMVQGQYVPMLPSVGAANQAVTGTGATTANPQLAAVTFYTAKPTLAVVLSKLSIAGAAPASTNNVQHIATIDGVAAAQAYIASNAGAGGFDTSLAVGIFPINSAGAHTFQQNYFLPNAVAMTIVGPDCNAFALLLSQ